MSLLMMAGMTLTISASFAQVVPGQPLRNWSLPDSINIKPNIQYGKHAETVLDVLSPSSTASRPMLRPGALLFHGGGYDHGNRREDVQEVFSRSLVKLGFVVANVDFRLGNNAKAPAAIEDGLLAARWFADHAVEFGVDPSRIIAMGASTGGHLALLIGMLPATSRIGPVTRIAAVVDLFGVTDISSPGPGDGMRARGWLSTDDAGLALAKVLSPIQHVRPGLPPILIIHGDQDRVVPYAQSVALRTRLEEAQNTVEFHTVFGNGHERPVEGEAYWLNMERWIADFLIRQRILR